MAWTTPGTAVAGSVLTSAFWNANVRDNSDYLKTEADYVGLSIIRPTSVSGTGVTSNGGLITASGSTTITINGVFSAAYANYQLVLDLVGSSANAINVKLRLAASGTPNSTSGNYFYASSGRASNNTDNTTQSDTTATAFDLAVSGTGLGQMGTEINLFNPFATQRTSFSGIYSYFNNATVFYTNNAAGSMTVTTSYDGFQLSTGTAATLTGNIRVYGRKNS